MSYYVHIKATDMFAGPYETQAAAHSVAAGNPVMSADEAARAGMRDNRIPIMPTRAYERFREMEDPRGCY